jgi:succinate dehydrogenase / fumarate reductase cytochrome b subunit
MNPWRQLFGSSLGKKYLMGLSGVVLAGFVLGHMAGNLQFFLPPVYINAYGHKLQTLPYNLLWAMRLFLLVCVVVHIWMAVVLTVENRRARPESYEVETTVEAGFASRTMIWSGGLLFLFILFHLFHFTVRSIYDYSALPYILHAEVVHDVYAMIYLGFSHWYVSIFYMVAMGFLCMHLSHGVSSMFQTLGFRNGKWRERLDRLAVVYGWVVFLGFISIPAAVLATKYCGVDLLDRAHVEATVALGKGIFAPH